MGIRQSLLLLPIILSLPKDHNHPFGQGNKRAAFAAAEYFLFLNGWEFTPPRPHRPGRPSCRSHHRRTGRRRVRGADSRACAEALASCVQPAELSRRRRSAPCFPQISWNKSPPTLDGESSRDS